MSPRNSIQIEEIRKKSKAKIIHSALELFTQKGYQQVSVSEIAKNAGVAKGLIYNYFQTKEDILNDIIHQISNEMIHFMESIEDADSPLQRIEKLINLTFQLFEEKKEFYKLIMALISQPVFSNLTNPLSSFIKVLIQDIGNSLDSMGIPNARTEAFKIGAMIDGIALHYLFTYNEKYPLEEMHQILSDHIKSLTRLN